MNQLLRLLIVEDSEDDAALLLRALRREGYEVVYKIVDTPAAMRAALESKQWDVITSDHAMPHFSAPEALELAKKLYPEIPFIIVSGEIDLNVAVSLMKNGAQDYIQKTELSRLVPAIRRELDEAKMRCEHQQIKDALLESEEKYWELVKYVPAGIYEVDYETGHLKSINDILCDYTGYTRDELLNMNYCDLFTEESLTYMAERLEKLQAREKISPKAEYCIRTKNGDKLWVILNARYIYENGKLKGAAGIVHDITERKRTEELLRKASGEWQETFDAVTDAICLLDFNQRITRCNRAMSKMFDVGQEELIGRYCWEIVHGTTEPIPECPTTRMKKSLVRETMDLQRGDRWFSVTADPILDEKRLLQGVVHIVRDITERKKTEAFLLESATMLQIMIDEAPVCVAMVDLDKRFFKCNKKFCAFLGYSEKEMQQKTIRDITFSEDAEIGMDDLRAIMAGEKNSSIVQKRYVRKDKTVVWGEVNINLIRNNQGQPMYFLPIIIDITERRKTEEVHSQLSAIVESADDAIISKDLEGVILSWNKGAEVEYGYNSKEIIGKSISLLMPPDHPDEYKDILAKIANGEKIKHYETKRVRKDGQIIDVALSVSPVKDTSGKITGASTITRNMTERKRVEDALRKSEDKYRTLIETTDTGYVIIDQDGLVRDANSEYVRLTGHHDLSEIVGRSVLEWTAESEKEKNAEAVKACFDQGYIRNLEIDYVDSKGNVTPVEINARCIEIEGETHTITICRDITERKRAEEALRESEEKFRMLSDQSLLGIGLLQKGVFKYVNQAFCDISGYTSAKIMTWQPYDYVKIVVHPDDKDLVMAPVDKEQDHAADVARQFEFRGLTKNGKMVWLDLYLKAVLYQGKYADLLSFIDITERKRAVEELQQSEEKFRILMESSPIAILLYQNNKWVYANPATTEITGYTEQELRGMNFWDIVHPDDKQLVQERGQKRQKGEGVPKRYIFRIISKDGAIKWIDLSGATVAIGGSPAGIISVLDITERKQAEEELRIYHEHLEDLVKERTVNLEAANKELEAFSYSVSHDLQAPLRSINGFSQALLEEYDSKLDAQGKNYLGRVMGATRRMTALIEDLMKLSRITRAEINIAEVNLTEIAQSVIDELRKFEPKRNINIKIAERLQDKTDARLMRIVLENLLGNAWKFTSKKPDASIEFGSMKKDNANVYFIRDNGAGFNMSYADKLFIPFQRLHSTEEYPGTGIGLATVQRIIHRHGGKVWAEGQKGRGATFYFTLH